MDIKERITLLKDEYLFLQQTYEDVDRRALTIKNWSVTVCLAAIGFGFQKSGFIFLLGFAASLLFWYIEAFWRGLHYYLAVRIKIIEEVFRNNSYQSATPLQIYTTWTEAFNKPQPEGGAKTFMYFTKPVTLMPHLVFAAICLILFTLWLLRVIEKTP